MIVLVSLLVLIGAFLIGSIPFGLVVSKLFFRVDLRDHGSGNIGATNAIRVMGKKAGIAVFLLDFAKGLAATFLAMLAGGWAAPDAGPAVFPTASAIMCLGFFAVVLGHCFSPWLGWNGGKGIAAAGGGLFVVLGPLGGVVELLVFGVFAMATRYASVGSLAAAFALIPFSLFRYIIMIPPDQSPAWLAFALCILTVFVVTWAHRQNIVRLRAGTENRFGSSGKKADAAAQTVAESAACGESQEAEAPRCANGSASDAAAGTAAEGHAACADEGGAR